MDKDVFSRLLAVEKPLRREKTSDEGSAWYQFQIAPTTPPSTSVFIRGGWYRQGYYQAAQETAWLPPITLDLADPTNFLINETIYLFAPGSFANAGWYQAIVLGYASGYFGDIVDGVEPSYYFKAWCGKEARIEYATALEAEQALDGWFDGTHEYGSSLPLRAVILKNNGVTGKDGQILPIDAVNRGRSYLWRDVRRRLSSGY